MRLKVEPSFEPVTLQCPNLDLAGAVPACTSSFATQGIDMQAFDTLPVRVFKLAEERACDGIPTVDAGVRCRLGFRG
jgi:hypothetical protein